MALGIQKQDSWPRIHEHVPIKQLFLSFNCVSLTLHPGVSVSGVKIVKFNPKAKKTCGTLGAPAGRVRTLTEINNVH